MPSEIGPIGFGGADRTRTELDPEKEVEFRRWFIPFALQNQLSHDPDDPLHRYDWRGAFKGGFTGHTSPDDGRPNFPSQFKDDDHPDRYSMVEGRLFDTKNDRFVK